MIRYVWLSHILDVNGPRPPGIPAPELANFSTLAKDGVGIQTIKFATHTGTHLDAPRHVIDGGLRIEDFTAEELIYTRPVLIDLKLADKETVMPEHLQPRRKDLDGADLALFKFDYNKTRLNEPERYVRSCPGFGVESAQWLRENCPHLRAVGLDVPSLSTIAYLEDTMPAHNVLLEGEGRRFLVVEEMVLDDDLTSLIEVRVSPWLVHNMDCGPCVVVGVLK